MSEPLLREPLPFMTGDEWREFQRRFDENPIEGNAYLNELEIERSAEVCYSWPRVLQFSLSSYCNITCRFCAQTKFAAMFDNPAFKMDDITVEKMTHMFRDVGVGYPYFVDFSGDGEPIVHPSFIELMEFARSRFPFSKLRTCSNGLALTKSMSEKMVEHRLDWLNISLNAGTAKGWEATTGNRNFDRVIDNIRYLQAHKQAVGSPFPVLGMTFVLTRHSLEDLPAFVDLCVELGADSAGVHHMTINFADFANDSVMMIKRRANEVLRATREKADRLGFQISLPTLFDDADADDDAAPPAIDFDFSANRREYVDAFARAKLRPSEDRVAPATDTESRPRREVRTAQRCRYPWDYFLIKGDGVTRICCGGLPAEGGSILQDGFWKAWNGDFRRYIRRTVNTSLIDEDCYYCPLNATRDVDEAGTHMRNTARAAREAAPA